jgi:hypothetical protein
MDWRDIYAMVATISTVIIVIGFFLRMGGVVKQIQILTDILMTNGKPDIIDQKHCRDCRTEICDTIKASAEHSRQEFRDYINRQSVSINNLTVTVNQLNEKVAVLWDLKTRH